MPSTSIAKNSKGIEITFTEDNHKYESIIDGKTINYTSVTQFIENFFPKFDKDKMAKIKSEKTGKSVDEIKGEWEKISLESCEYGTKVHEMCEDIILNRKHPRHTIEEFSVDKKRIVEFACKTAKSIYERMEILGVEKIVFDPYIKISGSVDLLAKHNDTYYILDWKTNKNLDIENSWDKYGIGLCEKIPDTPYGHYCLQLSLYQWLLKNDNIIPRDSKVERILLHCSKTGVEKIKLPDYELLVSNMIIEKMKKNE